MWRSVHLGSVRKRKEKKGKGSSSTRKGKEEGGITEGGEGEKMKGGTTGRGLRMAKEVRVGKVKSGRAGGRGLIQYLPCARLPA